jgi:hypothetical protein
VRPPPNEVEPDMVVFVEVNVTDRESGVNRSILSYTTDNDLTRNNITMKMFTQRWLDLLLLRFDCINLLTR